MKVVCINRLDPVMQHACGDVVTAACSNRAKGHGDIVTCLLDNLDHDDMTDECEEKLLEIQVRFHYTTRNKHFLNPVYHISN